MCLFNKIHVIFVCTRRCNETRRMSEGGLVMASSHANFYNNNNNNINDDGRTVTATVVPRRKFSFPAMLQSPSSTHAEPTSGLGGGANGGGPSLSVATARRRFSNVSDVVSRKLSHTIGWRTNVPTELISQQGKALCVQYVRWKLKRAGAYTKKCAKALRSVRTVSAAAATTADVRNGYFVPPQIGCGGGGADQTDGMTMRCQVFPAVLRIGLHLERLDPKLYAAGNATPSSAAADAAQFRNRNAVFAHTTAAVVLVSVSRELFRAGVQVTWAKIVSLVCLAAGLAVDCARRGHAEQLPDLIEAVGEVIEDDLAAWIHYHDGWVGILLEYNVM